VRDSGSRRALQWIPYGRTRHNNWPDFVVGIFNAVDGPNGRRPSAPQIQAPGLQCNGSKILDPFKGSLAGPSLPPGLLPIDPAGKDISLKSGLPCQENVSTGAQGDPNGKEASGLQNLQRGFDFYSWRTFIALNSPADGTPIEQAQANMPTRWEDMDNFKQLLDVMLPADLAEMANRSAGDDSRA
jgi:hypothetical protein